MKFRVFRHTVSITADKSIVPQDIQNMERVEKLNKRICRRFKKSYIPSNSKIMDIKDFLNFYSQESKYTYRPTLLAAKNYIESLKGEIR